MDNIQQIKTQCLEDIKNALPEYSTLLNQVDARIVEYISDAISEDGNHANIYELLGIRKVLRLVSSYELNKQRTQMVIRAIEGVWEGNKYIKGGLKFDTPRGNMNVRLMPYQVWCIFGIYGFTTEVDMDREYHKGDSLLPTEFVKDGRVWDKRRLTSEAHIFQTRKSGKTEFGSAIDFVDVCFLGPANGQALICTNSRDQGKIAYKAIKEFASQIDPSCINKGGGKYFRVTADEMNWLPGQPRKGEIKVMSAGGKTKDGLYASIVHADEHGSASYVKGHSDMQSLVDVCVGSMGPRREKLLLHTTTAGNVNEGPYQLQLREVEKMLLCELDYQLLQSCRTEEDKWFAFLLRLDPWEVDYDLDQLDNPVLFKKVNRSIGVTVQPTWYKERLHDARTNDDTRKEVLTKDFNIWQTGRITSWLKSDRIRSLQVGKLISDCKFEDGWSVFVGMDFSHGDDLFAIGYLGVNYADENPKGRFFMDCEAWVLEETMMKSPNRALYEKWVKAGWLFVCPGEVFDSARAIEQIATKQELGVNMVGFGYDPAQSIQPINNLKAWLQTLGVAVEDIQKLVVPVKQTALIQNPLISEIENLVKSNEELLQCSPSPLIPWCFGNCAIETTSSDLRRIVKGGPAATCKIDVVAAICDALYLFDFSEGNIQG